jgi:hypothetical protein
MLMNMTTAVTANILTMLFSLCRLLGCTVSGRAGVDRQTPSATTATCFGIDALRRLAIRLLSRQTKATESAITPYSTHVGGLRSPVTHGSVIIISPPYDIPEKLLEAKEQYYIEKKLTKMGIGKGGFTPETLACCTPENLPAVCEDYRAGAMIDLMMDEADIEAGHRIGCPTLVIWGEQSHTEKMFNPREAWPPYAANIVKFCPLPCGHYPAEQAPDETFKELVTFFKG